MDTSYSAFNNLALACIANGIKMAQRNFLPEAEYLNSILHHIKPSAPREPPANWDEFMKEQDKILNTLRGNFDERLVDLEQRMLRNAIRVFNVPEFEREDTKQLVLQLFLEKQNLKMADKDISSSCRKGLVRPGRPRCIVVHFNNDRARKFVLRRKGLLEKERIKVERELCPELLLIKNEAACKFGKESVKVGDEVIEVTTPEGELKKFQSVWMYRGFVKNYNDCRCKNLNVSDN